MCGLTAMIGVAGLAATAASTAVSAYGQSKAGEAADAAAQAQKEANEYNAKILDRNAGQIDTAITDVRSAEKEALLISGREAAEFKGKQQASLAASGVQVDTGSAADIMSTIDMIANEDAVTIRQNVNREIAKYKQEQFNIREQANMLRGMKYGTANTNLQVGSTVLTGASNFASQLNQLGTSAKWW